MISKLIKNIFSMGQKVTKKEQKKATKAISKKVVGKKTTNLNTKALPAKKVVTKPTIKPTTKKTTPVAKVVVPVKKAKKSNDTIENRPKKTNALPVKSAVKKITTIATKKNVSVKEKTVVAIKQENKKLTIKTKISAKKEIPPVNLKKILKSEKNTTIQAKTSPVIVKNEMQKTITNTPKEITKVIKKKSKKEIVPVPVRVAVPAADGKRKIIVDYKNVPDEVLKALSDKYPHGYNKGVIKFTNAKKELVSAVPIELGDTTYLVKISSQLQKMVNDYDEDDFFPDAVVPAEKEISVGVATDFDDFDKSDEDDSPKKKTKGKVKSADDLEYGFSEDDDEDDDDENDDDDDDGDVSDDDDGDDDDE